MYIFICIQHNTRGDGEIGKQSILKLNTFISTDWLYCTPQPLIEVQISPLTVPQSNSPTIRHPPYPSPSPSSQKHCVESGIMNQTQLVLFIVGWLPTHAAAKYVMFSLTAPKHTPSEPIDGKIIWAQWRGGRSERTLQRFRGILRSRGVVCTEGLGSRFKADEAKVHAKVMYNEV